MKRKRKSAFTLLEVLISFSLLAMVAALLFSHFKSAAMLSTRSESLKSFALKRQHIYQRLSQLFETIEEAEAYFYDEGKSALFTDSIEKTPRLHFGIKHRIDPKVEFSSYVTCMLWVNQEKELCLKLCPLQQDESNVTTRIETLLKGVSSMSFSFTKFLAKQESSKTPSIEIADEHPAKETKLPYAMTLKLTLEDDASPLEYTFFLTSEIKPIIYEG